ncbi:hypothetical protein AGLY_015759 [Aphis glycines]|uniref:Uncharacterized protein n=1 Tax=Aphis glycines TaxID=307491 RepID=A0A6G0T1S3_APHGL|nr:hypothetical protein AGLY_015759 [Aphis glycines]
MRSTICSSPLNKHRQWIQGFSDYANNNTCNPQQHNKDVIISESAGSIQLKFSNKYSFNLNYMNIQTTRKNNYTTVTNSISESGRRVNANNVRSGSPYRSDHLAITDSVPEFGGGNASTSLRRDTLARYHKIPYSSQIKINLVTHQRPSRVAILLSQVVYLLRLAEVLPESSDAVPLLEPLNKLEHKSVHKGYISKQKLHYLYFPCGIIVHTKIKYLSSKIISSTYQNFFILLRAYTNNR